jgi:hypothetical protein
MVVLVGVSLCTQPVEPSAYGLGPSTGATDSPRVSQPTLSRTFSRATVFGGGVSRFNWLDRVSRKPIANI